MKFDERLKELGLVDSVELAGSFCMERCGEGLNWEIDDEPVTSSSVEDALATFEKRIIAPLTGGGE